MSSDSIAALRGLQLNSSVMECLEGRSPKELRLSDMCVTAAAIAALPCCAALTFLEMTNVRVSLGGDEALEVLWHEPGLTGARIGSPNEADVHATALRIHRNPAHTCMLPSICILTVLCMKPGSLTTEQHRCAVALYFHARRTLFTTWHKNPQPINDKQMLSGALIPSLYQSDMPLISDVCETYVGSGVPHSHCWQV